MPATAATDAVPWGRRPVPDVPLPPFDDASTARDFLGSLALYVAALGDGVPTLDAFALSTVLQAERRALDYAPDHAWPTPTVLRVAVVTYFPAPWTPRLLNEALARAYDQDKMSERFEHADDDRIVWFSDPSFGAVRAADGSWTVTRSERGSDEVLRVVADDDDMVLFRMSFERDHPFPYGWGYDASRLASLVPAADAARTAWRGHATLPYLTNWADDLLRAQSCD